MPNMTVAPEDDDASPLTHDFGSSKDAVGKLVEAESQKNRVRFDPHKVGFGLLPWPGTEQSAGTEDTVAVAMRYLMRGEELEEEEDKI